MQLLLLVIPLFASLARTFSVSASKRLQFTRGFCNGTGPFNVPFLDSEMLDPIDLARLTRDPLLNLVGIYNHQDDFGGTAGFMPSHLRFERKAQTKLWKAPDADKNALADPSRSGLYFRHQVLNSQSYPWSTIGRVDFKRFPEDIGGWCTASLVGRNLMLTASHCFPWGFGSGRWMRFTPAFSNGNTPYGGSYVSRCRGVVNIWDVTGIDYIVCHLCEPLGEIAGWMGTHWWQRPENYTTKRWTSSGYPGDSLGGRAQMIRSNITLTDIDRHGDKGSELESNMYASPGWSGGPMWGYVDGAPKIVGICSGRESDCSERCLGKMGDGHDVSAGGRLMTDLVIYGMGHWAGQGH